jgi:predicted enzyme related to lactoylglutathione lyase
MAKPGVTAVGGVFLRAENPAELAKWYGETLGVPVGGDSDDNGAVSGIFTWRRDDNPEEQGMTVWALFPKSSEYLGDNAGAMINYCVEDIDATLAALEADGVWIDPHREDSEYGRFAWIKDPEGNRIELWQP